MLLKKAAILVALAQCVGSTASTTQLSTESFENSALSDGNYESMRGEIIEKSKLRDKLHRKLLDSSSPSNSPSMSFGPLLASYDAALGAPRCNAVGTSCDTGTSLIAGVGYLQEGGPEPNAPNTIDDCIEISEAVYQQDESINRIIVESIDGGPMMEGSWVRIIASVFTANDTSGRAVADALDTIQFYYTANATYETTWKYIKSGTAIPGSGEVNKTCEYRLPYGGEMQAVRVNYGYAEYKIGPCTSYGSYSDVDDLVFVVAKGPPTEQPSEAPSMTPSLSMAPSMSSLPSITSSPSSTSTSMAPLEPLDPATSPSQQPSSHLEVLLPSSSFSNLVGFRWISMACLIASFGYWLIN